MANYQPPTEEVPIFNGKYFQAEQITTKNGDGRYLKLIAQGDEDMNNYDIININQVDTQSVKFGDGTIQTTAGGGGGGVSNPMSANLDAGGYNIFNQSRTNDTETPVLYNYGAITPQEYGILRVPNRATGTAITMIQLRALDLGLSHQLLIQVIGYDNKSVIRIINNVSESDTLVFTNIRYGQDPNIPLDNVLTFQAGVSATNVEYSIFQNGNSVHSTGNNFLPIPTATPITLTNIFTDIDVELNTSGTTGNWRTKGTTYALDTQTTGLSTQQFRNITGNDIQTLNNINMVGNSLKQVNTIAVDNIGVNVGSEIQSTASINLGGNDLQNVNNVRTDNIFENTPANGIVVHNTLNMSNNHIHNLSTPTQNGDGANKLYVDQQVATGLTNPLQSDLDGGGFKATNFNTPISNNDLATKFYVDSQVGGSGVQNPMTSNLDGGGFQLTNCSFVEGNTLQTTPGVATGRLLSNGIFTHGGVSAGELQANGTIHRFAPSLNWRIQNFAGTTTYFDYEQASQILTTQNGATQAIASGSKLTLSGGGTLQLNLTSTIANQNEELSLLDINGGENQILQTQGNSNNVPNIPQSLNPILFVNLMNEDVGVYQPFTSGLGWDNTSNGLTIPLYETNSLTGRYGEPIGLNNNQVNIFPFNSYLCGFGINCASNLGGWICSGGATLELVYTLTGLSDQSFSPPIIVAQAGNSLTAEVIQIPKTSWIYADRKTETGIGLSLKLNIPPGGIIDTQDPLNKRLNANKVQVAIIDML